MDRHSHARRRMMIFVMTIFVLACLVAVYFAFALHPGEPAPPNAGTVSSQVH